MGNFLSIFLPRLPICRVRIHLGSEAIPRAGSLCMDLEKGGGIPKKAGGKLTTFVDNNKARPEDVKGVASCVRDV